MRPVTKPPAALPQNCYGKWNVTVSAEFPSQKDWNDELLADRQEETQGLTMSM